MEGWPFIPQRGIKEKYEWLTEVIRTKSSEQRISLRPVPRVKIEQTFQLRGPEGYAASELAKQYGKTGEMIIPLWSDLLPLSNLSQGAVSLSVGFDDARFIEGQYVYIIGLDNRFEFKQIETLTNNSIYLTSALEMSYGECHVVPALTGLMSSDWSMTKRSDLYLIGKCEFYISQEIPNSPANPFPSYLGLTVLTSRPILEGSKTDKHRREAIEFDSVAGPISYQTEYADPISDGTIMWSLDTRQQIKELRNWFYVLKGKMTSFYMPRWVNEFQASRPISSGTAYVYIERNPALDHTYVGPVCIVKRDGSLVFAEIQMISNVNEDEDSLLMTTTFNDTIPLNDIEMVCKLVEMRLNTDTIEFSYTESNGADVKASVIEVT